MDLTNQKPRSPYERLGGIVFLPRAIDKGRADLEGKLGEYFSRTGYSKTLFDFLGIAPDSFIEALKDHSTDQSVLEWVQSNMTKQTAAEIEEFNRSMENRTPQDPEAWARYRKFLSDVGQGHRTDLSRQFDRLDLDEGREVPAGGRK